MVSTNNFSSFSLVLLTHKVFVNYPPFNYRFISVNGNVFSIQFRLVFVFVNDNNLDEEDLFEILCHL